MGPHLQWTGEKAADPIEIRIYRGASTSFTLYEDDGTTMAYTTAGEYATVELSWDDRGQTLQIGARAGAGYPGMLKNRTFEVVVVRPGYGVGLAPTATPNATVRYSGAATNLSFHNGVF